VDAAGDATVGWSQFDGTDYEVDIASRPAGGPWGAPTRLSLPGENAGGVRIAANARGDAVAVWETFNPLPGPGDRSAVASTRSGPTGEWSAPVVLAETGAAIPEQQVAIDAQGDAVALWTAAGEHEARVETSFLPVGGSWSAPAPLSPGKSDGRPGLTVDPHGNFTAIWEGFDRIETAERQAGSASWGEPTLLSDQFVGSPTIAAGAGGDVAAAWILALNNDERRIETAFKPAGGAWGPPSDASAIHEVIWRPSIAVDSHGDSAVIWSAASETIDGPVEAAFRPAGGDWQPPTQLAETGAGDTRPRVMFGPADEALALWWGTAVGGVIQSATRPAGGDWQPPTTLAGGVPYSSRPELAIDPRGDAAAIWENGLGFGQGTVQAAGYSAAPTLGQVSIPATARVGEPVLFAASPASVWSTVGATAWDFGDGSSAVGTNPTHTYTTAGTYTVTLTSTDLQGTATTTTGNVTVTRAASEWPAPEVTGLAQSRTRWRERNAPAAASHRAKIPIGTSFSFALNVQSRVTLTFSESLAGRLHNHHCVRPTKANRQHRACTRTITRGVLAVDGPPGANSIPFAGGLAGARKLPPGRYTVSVVATNPVGARSSARKLSFTIAP
jgi:hypothetical protein